MRDDLVLELRQVVGLVVDVQRLADGALDVTQVLDHVVELLDRLDAHDHDAVVLVRPVDGLLEPGRLERVVDQVVVVLQLAPRDRDHGVGVACARASGLV